MISFALYFTSPTFGLFVHGGYIGQATTSCRCSEEWLATQFGTSEFKAQAKRASPRPRANRLRARTRSKQIFLHAMRTVLITKVHFWNCKRRKGHSTSQDSCRHCPRTSRLGWIKRKVSQKSWSACSKRKHKKLTGNRRFHTRKQWCSSWAPWCSSCHEDTGWSSNSETKKRNSVLEYYRSTARWYTCVQTSA